MKTIAKFLAIMTFVLVVVGCPTPVEPPAPTMYTVTFDTDGGSSVASITVEKGKTISLPVVPIKEGHIFSGWYIDDETFANEFTASSTIVANITVFAKWSEAVSINFDVNEGSISHTSITVPKGGTPTTLPIPTREGYLFEGWYTDDVTFQSTFTINATVNSDITVYAKWTEVPAGSIVVTFDANGGTVNPTSKTVLIGGTIADLPTPILDGFIFIDWFTDLNDDTTKLTITTVVSENITVYAKWRVAEAIKHTVSFETNGGMNVDSIIVDDGKAITLPTIPTKNEFVFSGWFLDDVSFQNEFTSATVVSSDIMLYAKWEEACKITFKSDQWMATSAAPMYVKKGSKPKHLPVTMYKSSVDSHLFLGWYTERNGSGTELTIDTIITEDMTVYGSWGSRSYSKFVVAFDAKEGYVDPLNVAVLQDTFVSSIPIPTKEGHDFIGWFFLSGGIEKPFMKTTQITQNTLVYAKWSTNALTVTFDTKEGTAVNPVKVEQNSSVISLPETTRKGYLFKGWFINEETPFTTETSITENIEVYAKWEKAVFVTFIENEGYAVDPITLEPNTILDKLPLGLRDGYAFLGWHTDEALLNKFDNTTAITTDIKLYAKWLEDSTGLDYDVIGNNVYVEKGYSFNARNLVIASSFNGKAVTVIGNYLLDGEFKGEDIESVIMPDTIKYIREAAFKNCTSLTDITLPESVISIEQAAFEGCTNLRSINIPKNIKTIALNTFNDCSALESIVLPEGITKLNSKSFGGCTSLHSINIPETVSNISDNAFANCTSLTEMYIPSSVTDIDGHIFSGCSNLTNIEVDSDNPNYKTIDSTIYSKDGKILVGINPSVTTFTVPSHVEEIASGAFDNSEKLTRVDFAGSVKKIGHHAFAGCDNLVEIVLPEGLLAIESGLFSLCGKLERVTIPSTVTSIGSKAFWHCKSLLEITIPNSVTSIGENTFEECSALQTVTLPNKITSIEYKTFYECISITNINIPSTVTSIGGRAFYNVKKLQSITLPDELESIGSYALASMDALTDMFIPINVATIGEYAFSSSTGIPRLRLQASSTPVTWDENWNVKLNGFSVTYFSVQHNQSR